jgi:hypothetical protein
LRHTKAADAGAQPFCFSWSRVSCLHFLQKEKARWKARQSTYMVWWLLMRVGIGWAVREARLRAKGRKFEP